MKMRRYVPGVWKGNEGMLPLTEEDWLDLMRKNRTEIEADERKRTTIPTPSDREAA